MTLADARLAASRARLDVDAGNAPVATSRASRTPPEGGAGVPTLGRAVDEWIAHARGGWRSRTEEVHSRNQLLNHAGPLYARPVDTIKRADIINILAPIWERQAVARRLLSRLSQVFLRAVALGHIEVSPADSRVIVALMPRTRYKQQHHPAAPWAEAPALYAKLRGRNNIAAHCLALIILTATRSGEARGALWSEFQLDGDRPVWVISAERTKTEKLLEVPLSEQAVALMRSLPRFAGTELVFPGRTLRPITDMAVLKEQRYLHDVYTVHGWRSCWRDWGGAQQFDGTLLELGLGHAVGTAVERAYARSSHIELRRPIIQAWADFITGKSQGTR